MYKRIKQILKFIVPKNLLFKYEDKFRAILYVFYQGNNFECPICDKKLRSFIALKNSDLLCPSCGSLSRDRRLWTILSDEFLKENISILDFSPSRSLFKKFKKVKNISYSSTDLSGDFHADYQFDITHIQSKNCDYDLIICYHVLEHIPDDILAMQELHRVLTEGGTCLIQTPFKEGNIYENPIIVTEKERLLHFGQEDHVRIYSLSGLEERLKRVGFKVEIRNYPDTLENRYGFKSNENIFFCKK